MFCRDGKKKNGVQVKISEFEKGDKKKTLCKLEIDKVKRLVNNAGNELIIHVLICGFLVIYR